MRSKVGSRGWGEWMESRKGERGTAGGRVSEWIGMASEWIACRVSEWTAGRVSEWIAGRVSEWIAGRVNGWE